MGARMCSHDCESIQVLGGASKLKTPVIRWSCVMRSRMSDKVTTSHKEVRLEARLLAIENILAGLVADINRRRGVSFEEFSAAANEMQQELRQQLVVPGQDSAISALVAAEVEGAIEAL